MTAVRRRRCPTFLSGVVVVTALTACATAPQTSELGESRPADLSQQVELERVPFFPQSDYQCGPAALATVLADLGEPVTADDLVGEVYVPARKGSLQAEMRASARGRGYVSYPLQGGLESLFREVDSGRPVLVMQNLGLDWVPTWHYAVVIGYDLDRSKVILRSETIHRHTPGMSTFERTWARADHWAQVVVPPGEPPVTARPVEWLEAVHELEQIGRMDAAITGYHATTERWPEFHPGWMALGNAKFGRDNHAGAADAFLSAVWAEPDAWSGWNNLAHALAATGCGAVAAKAADCAVALAPDEPATRSTLESLGGTTGNSGNCPTLPACPAPRPSQ